MNWLSRFLSLFRRAPDRHFEEIAARHPTLEQIEALHTNANTADKIASGAIKFVAGSIQTDRIQANSVRTGRIMSLDEMCAGLSHEDAEYVRHEWRQLCAELQAEVDRRDMRRQSPSP